MRTQCALPARLAFRFQSPVQARRPPRPIRKFAPRVNSITAVWPLSIRVFALLYDLIPMSSLRCASPTILNRQTASTSDWRVDFLAESVPPETDIANRSDVYQLTSGD